MKCPNCGAPEKTRVRVCSSCDEAFATEDLRELDQLEYFLKEAEGLAIRESLRRPYKIKLEELKARILPTPEPARPVEEITRELDMVRAVIPLIPSWYDDKYLNVQSSVNLKEYLSEEVENLLKELGDHQHTGLIPDELEVTGFILDSIEGWHNEGLVTASMKLRKAIVLQREEILSPPPKVIEEVIIPDPEPEPEPEPVKVEPEPVKAEPKPKPKPAPVKVKAPPKPKPAPPKEKVPFDQWLLSERNIKVALYSGAVLLVIAGIIFVGKNWADFPGLVQFAVTLFVTVSMYLGGYWLFKKPALQLGGNALIGIASGFMVLNFAVLQIGVLGPEGFPDEVMWLTASVLSLALYILTGRWTKSDLFTYFSLAAAGSAITAALVVLGSPALGFVLAYAVFLFLLLGLSQWFKGSSAEDFTSSQLWWVSQIGMPLVIFVAMFFWSANTNCTECTSGSPWLAVISLIIGVLFYLATDAFTKTLTSRWITVVFFTAVLGIVASEMDFSETSLVITFLTQAIAFLVIGYFLESYGEPKSKTTPIYIIAYILAAAVTIAAAADWRDFATVLLGDVVFLTVASFVQKKFSLVYGAVWLLIVPVYIIAALRTGDVHAQGLQLSALGMSYVIAGFVLGRRELKQSGPFLTAAAFLSVVVVIMTWSVPQTSLIVLGVVAGLYLFTAIWQGWPISLVPALLAVNLFIFPLNKLMFDGNLTTAHLTVSFTILGTICLILARGLQRFNAEKWRWPLILFGTVNFVNVYPTSLLLGKWHAISISVVLSAFLLLFAWWERAFFTKQKLHILPYLGVVTIFIGHYYVVGTLGESNIWEYAPGITAGLSALFSIVSWLVRGREGSKVYEMPFRLAGLGFMAIPLGASLFIDEPLTRVITFALAGSMYLVEAGLRRITQFAYLGIGIIFVGHFYLLDILGLMADDYRGLMAWPVFTAGLCALFAVLSLWVRSKDLAAVFEAPLRFAGLGLMVMPLYYSVAIYDPLIRVAAFTIAGAVYLIEAGFRRNVVFSYLGIGMVFIAQFYLLEELDLMGDISTGLVSWPLFTAGLCTIFAVLSWVMRRKKTGEFYELPLRIAGLGLMAIPIFVLSLPVNPALSALIFGIGGTIYLIEAVVSREIAFSYLGIGVIFAGHFYLMDEFGLLNGDITGLLAWPVFTVGLCALFAVLSWLLRGKKLAEIYEEPLRIAGMGLMFIPLIGSTFYADSIISVAAFAVGGVIYLLEAALRRESVFSYVGIGLIFIGHFYLLDVFKLLDDDITGLITWPVFTAGLCALFAALSWLLRGKKLADTFEEPLRIAGLGLMFIPIVGSVILFDSIVVVVTFAIASVIYLLEAGLHREIEFSYLGIGLIFVGHFYLLVVLNIFDNVDAGLMVWPVFTAGLCALFAALSWLLRGKKLADIYEDPLRLAGLGLMAIPVIGSVLIFDSPVSVAAFAIGGVIYLLEAWLRKDIAFSYLGIGLIFVGHFYLLDVLNLMDHYFTGVLVWPVFTAAFCAFFAALSWLLKGKIFTEIFKEPVRFAGLGLLIFPIYGSAVIYDSLVFIAVLAISSFIYLVEAGVGGDKYFAYLGIGMVFVGHFFVLDVLGGSGIWEIWTMFTAGLCALFAALSWLLKGKKYSEVYEEPLRVAGLGLMFIPLVGSIFPENPLVSGLTFTIGAAVYLLEAWLRRDISFAYLGVGAFFIGHFYYLDALGLMGDGKSEILVWPVFTAGLCALFAVLSWLLRGRKAAEIYENPLRYAGLGLLLIPVYASVAQYGSIISVITFTIAGAIYLIEAGIKHNPSFTYLGIGMFFIGHFFLLDVFSLLDESSSGRIVWPIFTVSLCALFTGLSWLLKKRESNEVFGKPLSAAGLLLMIIPLGGSIQIQDPHIVFAAFAIAGVVYMVDAWIGRNVEQFYIGMAAFVFAFWALLYAEGVQELQAYALPLGLVLLGAGWYERIYVQRRFYYLFTILGLLLLMGSAFVQSRDEGAWIYAVLLAVESVLTFVWGMRYHSRSFVQIGGLAFILNAGFQFGPAFIDLPSWIHIGLTGIILVGGGIFALLKREELLETREKLTDEWRSWEP